MKLKEQERLDRIERSRKLEQEEMELKNNAFEGIRVFHVPKNAIRATSSKVRMERSQSRRNDPDNEKTVTNTVESSI